MFRRLIIIVLLVNLLHFLAPPAVAGTVLVIPIDETFVNDAAIRAFFTDVLRQGGAGQRSTERAAFVVRTENGYRCLLWPHTGRFQRETYAGPVPDDTVAIVHNHPDRYPDPSRGDQKLAMQLGIPIFVVTRAHISFAAASGQTTIAVRNKRWSVARPQSRCQAMP